MSTDFASHRTFKTDGINSVLFIQERVIMANCDKRHTVNISSLDEGEDANEEKLSFLRITLLF